MNNPITTKTQIKADIATAWQCYTTPENIKNWNFASPDWCCPSATMELKEGGKFNYRMESRDGSVGFDFSGIFDKVVENKLLAYTMLDFSSLDNQESKIEGRKVEVIFEELAPELTSVIVSFEPENQNPREMQE